MAAALRITLLGLFGLTLAQPASDTLVLARFNTTRSFNEIGTHAADLRKAMTHDDAQAFDPVMLDVMSALMALPNVRLSGPSNPGICAKEPRPEQIPQLDPDLRALDHFFLRLQQTAASPADARMFARARKSVHRMLAGVPQILPTITAKSVRGTQPK